MFTRANSIQFLNNLSSTTTNMSRVLIYRALFMCALLAVVDARLDVIVKTSNSTETLTYFAAPIRFRNNNQKIDVITAPAQYIVRSEIDERDNMDFTGQIALLEFTFRRDVVWSFAVDAQEKGAVGIILSYSQFFRKF